MDNHEKWRDPNLSLILLSDLLESNRTYVGEDVNERISLMRAERIKMVLGQWLIPADRIEVEGCGIKHDAPNDSEARVAVITEIK